MYLLACREPSAAPPLQRAGRRSRCSCGVAADGAVQSHGGSAPAPGADFTLAPLIYLFTPRISAGPYITAPCALLFRGDSHRHPDEEFMLRIKYGHLNDYQIYSGQAWPITPK